MQIIFEIIISFFLIFGAFFMLVGSIGMIRLPDLFMRLHAPTKSSTLGLGSFLIAAMVFGATQGRFGFAELLITLFATTVGYDIPERSALCLTILNSLL